MNKFLSNFNENSFHSIKFIKKRPINPCHHMTRLHVEVPFHQLLELNLGPNFNMKTIFPDIGIIMGISVPVRCHLYIETNLCLLRYQKSVTMSGFFVFIFSSPFCNPVSMLAQGHTLHVIWSYWNMFMWAPIPRHVIHYLHTYHLDYLERSQTNCSDYFNLY